MRAPLGTLIIRYRTRLAACQRPFAGRRALIAAAMSVALPMSAAAQRADGAIGVSLVIAPPVEIRTVAITELRVDGDGMISSGTARPAAASPVTVRVSSRIAGSSDRSARERYRRAELVERTASRELRVRKELLVAAGT